ncbi:MAG: CvpA family protein [Synergistaceae bacterium]|nr:CvpA family protein [Synergistaceae bacterium]MBQ9403918.1 CvpA family protein [Synergistaceae bacterium]
MQAGLIVDIIICVILLFFLYRGFVRGFSGEIIGFVGLFVAIFCAWNFLDPAVDLVFKHFSHPALDRNIVSLICAVAIFFTVEIIFGIIGLILSYVVRVTSLSLMDHFFGMVIGALKAGFIIMAIYAVLITFSPLIPTDWMKESYTMQGAETVWPYVRDFMQSKGLLDFTHLTGNAN